MTIADEIAALLEAERRAIRNGVLSDLASFGDRKEQLFKRLAASKSDEGTLASLKRQAERNSALLEATQRGLGAALTQIGMAQAAATPQTYGPEGERDALGPNTHRIEKRC